MDEITSQAALLEAAAVELDKMAAELDELRKAAVEPIAIVGIGLRLAGGVERYSDFVSALLEGTRIAPRSVAERWGGRIGGADWPVYAVESVERFDAQYFGFSPSEACAMDPQHRLLLACTAEALEDAGIIGDPLNGLNGGVFLGQCFDDHAIELSLRAGEGGLDTYSVVGAARNLATTRVARAFGLEGPAASIDGSCASSLMAAHLAMQSLRARECDFALIGGLNLVLSPTSSSGFSKLGVLSPSGQCQPFSERADGYVRGEGVIVLVAMRAADTGSRRVYGQLERSACGQNGFTGSLIAPKGSAQARVIATAWQGIEGIQDQISFVEAQAVGNRIGDAIEMQALNGVAEDFGRASSDPIKLTSVKRIFGHLEGAAGCASLIAAFAQLEAGFCAANPGGPVEFDSARFPHVVPAQSGDKLSKEAGCTIKAGVSAFGMSGLNVHMVVSGSPAHDDRPPQLFHHFAALVVSAHNEDACCQQAGALAKFLRENETLDLASVAASIITGRRLHPFRIAIPISPDVTSNDIADQLEEATSSASIPPCATPSHIHVQVLDDAAVPTSTELLDAFKFWSSLSTVPVTFEGLEPRAMQESGLASRPSKDSQRTSTANCLAIIEVDRQNAETFVARFLEVAQLSPTRLKRYVSARHGAMPFFQFRADDQTTRNRQSLAQTQAPSFVEPPNASNDVGHGDLLAVIARNISKPELISDAISLDSLGLDSLAIIQLIHQVEDIYGVTIGLADYDQLHSVGDLGRVIHRKQLLRNMIVEQGKPLPSSLMEIAS
jgi:3-oxoacyl-(acyl-carrier-protein) synthase/acyl carrier protein